MNKVIFHADQNVPIKLWLNDIETGAYGQAVNLSKLPFAFKHIAIMPDSHQGYGMPIGGVLATQKVVIPNAVGVDIGCGMCAVKTSLKADQLDRETLKKILGQIREVVPVGVGKHHKEKQDESLMPYDKNAHLAISMTFVDGKYPVVSGQYSSALKQLGTLGSGNHFIEIQKEITECPECNGKGINDYSYLRGMKQYEECACKGTGRLNGYIWIMIHSGSRNLGYKVANHYNKVATELNKKWFTSVPKKYELAFLPWESEEGKSYLREMNYCVEFALASRKLMMTRIIDIFYKVMQHKTRNYPEIINIAHNYATMENHFGTNVMVHRKGATSAREGQLGIIPGSQGTKSYIIKGKGNPESFMSCSHGAGRKMSRTKAKNELNLEDEIKKMEERGIIYSIRDKNNLDEASSDYKDINIVMENQKDLVDIIVELTPLGVIKG